jgi:hypothetical protein
VRCFHFLGWCYRNQSSSLGVPPQNVSCRGT